MYELTVSEFNFIATFSFLRRYDTVVLIGLFGNGLNWLNAAGQYIEVIEFHDTHYVMLLPILDFLYS